jgi:hypothetical protein
VPSRPSWHRIFNDLVPLTHDGSGLTIFERGGQGLEVRQCYPYRVIAVQRPKRQNAVLLAAVVVAKHAFYRFHRTFRTSFDVPKPHYLLF